MSFKRTKVVMLPTNEKAKHGDLTLTPTDSQKVTIFDGFSSSQLAQHLYFLSDDEIKEGDWVYRFDSKDIFKADAYLIYLINIGSTEFCKKIIVTTDKKLFINIPDSKHYNSGMYTRSLPEPSKGFIQKFVDSYNSGNPIIEVDVEYNHLSSTTGINEEWIKVNTKDNTITIKKVKDSWGRDEVVNLLQQFNNDKSGVFDCTGWIEENL
jgi:hypothetical protein